MAQTNEQKKGFWTTLPGVLTAIAALITAIGGIVGLVVVPGGSDEESDDGPTRTTWVRQADELCSQAYDSLRQYPPITDLNTLVSVGPSIAEEARDLAADLRGLRAPEEDQSTIARMTGLLDEQSDGVDAAVVAVSQGDQAGFRRSVQQVESASVEGDAVAESLGATACAQTPVSVGFVP
jgi:hypothetical protein